MAPEIVRRVEYEGKGVDIWSLGILLYALLCGCFPFRAKAYPDLYRRIARGTFAIPEELSAPVKDLLRQLLTVDPDTRISAHNALRHSWLQSQYINAPNMDKLRSDITILISEKPADDLDEQVINELCIYGITRDEVIRLILTKTHSSLSTLYYLLLDIIVTRRKNSGGGAKKGLSNTIAAAVVGNGAAAASSLKYSQPRKTVANVSSTNLNNTTAASLTPSQQQQMNNSNNFPNPILSSSSSGIKPVTNGPIVVTQAIYEAALLAQQQQSNYSGGFDGGNGNGNGDRQDYSRFSSGAGAVGGGAPGGNSRPKSAVQHRVSNLSNLTNNNNAAINNSIGGGGSSNSNQQQMPSNLANVIAPVPIHVTAAQQRPLSAYAGRR
jgi:serine/threonine protein kinase